MIRLLIAFLLLTPVFPAPADFLLPDGGLAFSAKDSTEAELTFAGRVEMERDRKPSKRAAQDQVEMQLMHLFGPMAESGKKAVPKGEHTIKITSIKADGDRDGVYIVDYKYEGLIVLEKGPRSQYEIVLPVNPETIYAQAMVGSRNPCTDEHYQAEGDFWYFWNPKQPGCKLRQGVHYLKIKADIERIKNEKRTYPEYDRLADKKGVIKISILMGMDEPKGGRDPNVSRDVNAENFRRLKRWLTQSGYTSTVSRRADIGEIAPLELLRQLPYVENFVKKHDGVTVEVEIFFAPSGIDEDSTAFHFYFKDALQKSAILMYDGHSGLGGHLDLRGIESMQGFRFQPAKNRYQIYFFNSCSSYTYYNTMYFSRKRTVKDPDGTKNLDIMTNGLATYFSTLQDANTALLKAVDAWAAKGKWTSYQELAKQIDSDNLFGVNGDEDNPKSPRR